MITVLTTYAYPCSIGELPYTAFIGIARKHVSDIWQHLHVSTKLKWGELHWVIHDSRIAHCSQEPYKLLFVIALSPAFT